MNGGDGPCRLGQYIQVFKLLFWRIFGGAAIGSAAPGALSSGVRLLENISTSLNDKRDFSGAFTAWAGILGYQALVVHGLCYSLLLKAAARCRQEGDFQELMADYRQLKDNLIDHIALRARPGRAAEETVRFISDRAPALAGAAKYLGYGIFRNFGLRPYFRAFALKWTLPSGNGRPADRSLLRIHLDGEVYMRVCQAEQLLQLLNAYLGYGAFALTLTPTWCFMESVLYNRVINARTLWADLDGERRSAGEIAAGAVTAARNQQARLATDAERLIAQLRDLLARPLYAAAGVAMPHPMKEVYAAAQPIIHTGKPYGELVPFVGEAILKCREGADLILNVAPEGCMVSGMGDMLIPSILAQSGREGRTAIASLCSRDGEIREEELRLALLKTLGEQWPGFLPPGAP